MIADNVDDLITSLEQAWNGLIEWFKNNFLKSNAEKCYLLVSTNDRVSMNVNGFKIDKSDTEKLLVVEFAKKLIFYDHISDLCKKPGRKISALTRVTSYLGTGKKHIQVNILFTSDFSNCPLVWMCYSRTSNNKMNVLHERCLRIACNDKHSWVSWKRLLSLNSREEYTNLATEMYKLVNNLSLPIMNRVLKLNSDSYYNLRQISQFSRSLLKLVYHGTESISYLVPKIWDILPDVYKTIQNLNTLKIKIKKRKPENCPCRLCKVYIDRVCFL